MSNRYWDGLVQTRLNRRRVIAGTGAAALGAAFLAACGGGSDSSSSSDKGGTKSSSDKLFKPADTSKQAVSGGIWQRIYPGTVLAANVDPYASVGLNTGLALYSHSRLFQYKTTASNL